MVHVDVDDGDAGESPGERVRRADRDVVVQAEAHGAVPLGVMPGRPDQSERRRSSIKRMVDSADGRPCRQEGDLLRFWRRKRVGVEHHGPACRCVDFVEVLRAVDARKLLTRGGSRLDSVATTRSPVGGDPIEDLRPLDPLRMAGWRDVGTEPG